MPCFVQQLVSVGVRDEVLICLEQKDRTLRVDVAVSPLGPDFLLPCHSRSLYAACLFPISKTSVGLLMETSESSIGGSNSSQNSPTEQKLVIGIGEFEWSLKHQGTKVEIQGSQ